MYIVWRSRPVKSDNKASFLQGNVKAYGEGADTTWKPMYCEHRGQGRVARTPLLMRSERRDGKPRQQLLWRLPTIRSCCIADCLHRTAWWYEVYRIIAVWERGVWQGALDNIRRDKCSILASLREVVPSLTCAGFRDFKAYREQKEQEYQARRESVRAEEEAFHAEQRRREEEAFHAEQRRREEEVRRRAEEWRWYGRGSNFAVLGLPPDATPEQVKRRHRELVMLHHPDHGGDAEQFKRVQRAYEEISVLLRRRTPA